MCISQGGTDDDANKSPPGWDEDREQSVIAHYDQQTEAESVSEDEAAFQDKSSRLMAIPTELVPAVRVCKVLVINPNIFCRRELRFPIVRDSEIAPTSSICIFLQIFYTSLLCLN